MTTQPPSNLTRQRLAIQLLGAQFDVGDAIAAATRIQSHLAPPNILNYVSPASDAGSLPSLLQRTNYPTFGELPTILFDRYPNLSATEMPMDWISLFLAWVARHRRWNEFQRRRQMIQDRSDAQILPNSLLATDAITAGLLLYQLSPEPQSELRKKLFALAMTDPIGAYLTAEGNNVPEERPLILNALRDHGRLLYWTSHLPGFGTLCLNALNSKNNLWAGLALQHHGASSKDWVGWLQRVTEAACHDADAAQAALVLQPAAPKKQKDVWIHTLQTAAARTAFDCTYWARYVWPAADWRKLKDDLRLRATSDRGQWWCHWSLFEPKYIYRDHQRQAADPLWTIELLGTLRRRDSTVEDRWLRNQMVERLIHSHGDPTANLVLRYLNDVRDGGAA